MTEPPDTGESEDPYTAPRGAEGLGPKLDPETAPIEEWQRHAPVSGCLGGGCLAPIGLFVIGALFTRDQGGPLFWPIFALFTGTIGLIIGTIIRALAVAKVRKRLSAREKQKPPFPW